MCGRRRSSAASPATRRRWTGRCTSSFPRDIGQVEIVTDVPERAVLQAVEELRSLSQALSRRKFRTE